MCMYLCMDVGIYVLCMYLCMCVFLCIMCVCICICVCACMYVCVSMYVCRFSEIKLLGASVPPQSGESHLPLAQLDSARLAHAEPPSKNPYRGPQIRSSPYALSFLYSFTPLCPHEYRGTIRSTKLPPILIFRICHLWRIISATLRPSVSLHGNTIIPVRPSRLPLTPRMYIRMYMYVYM